MISVIMPVWNGAKFIDRTIASVIAQTLPEWELLNHGENFKGFFLVKIISFGPQYTW
jgi:hypothetical protein